MTPTWQPVDPRQHYGLGRDVVIHQMDIQVLRSGADGPILAVLEDFGYAAYPRALNSVTGNWERGGAHMGLAKYDPVTKIKIEDGDQEEARVRAKLWAERVAGLHPTKPGDERPPFYYSNEHKKDDPNATGSD